ncbi:alpha/beta fold hydrolase [Flammeovirga agarivorans]|uniref:Alpha/beta hydrolase n=1 Tax=Flammeovirga agarivorans TaxID=2726742 RepID=A0A7X8XY29_9BACT|nr:alpha/beta hydrolase [Flammeovirga agarivorans]NLR93812.1 alpha/beta hydrolase [Flammeovirga agarivorans]
MKNVKINGNTIEYQEYGIGQSLIFIHGTLSSGQTWRKIIPSLSKKYRCIVPEWPFGGHKVAVSQQVDLSPNGISDLIYQFFVAMNLSKAAIICNDTGGAYTQIFASKHQEMISQLVISNCEGFEIFPPKKFQSLQFMVQVPGYLWTMSKLFQYKPSLKWDLSFGLLSNALNPEELYEHYAKHFVADDLIRENFKRLVLGWNPKYTEKAAADLKEFNKPVLILWGMDDLDMFPLELGERIRNIFPNVEFVKIENAKTYVQEDNPQDFVENIHQFLDV